MTNAMNKRQSHGLTLPQTADGRDSVVSNILTSLATLDETAQLHWIQETSRQVDHEREYQRRENGVVNGNNTGYDRYEGIRELDEPVELPGVGYRDRGRATAGKKDQFGAITTVAAAPSPAVPMGRPSKQGFFRRFMGIGPKVPIESEILISTPKVLLKNTSSAQVQFI